MIKIRVFNIQLEKDVFHNEDLIFQNDNILAEHISLKDHINEIIQMAQEELGTSFLSCDISCWKDEAMTIRYDDGSLTTGDTINTGSIIVEDSKKLLN